LIHLCSSLVVEFLDAFQIHISTRFMHVRVSSENLLNSFRPSARTSDSALIKTRKLIKESSWNVVLENFIWNYCSISVLV